MPEIDYRIGLEQLDHLGRDLSRPECILAQANGTLWISDDRSGVLRLAPDGSQKRIGSLGGAPNGIAMDRDGSFVVANIEAGTLQRLERDGRDEILLDNLEGRPLGAVNFVLFDRAWRLWCSVSTRTSPRRTAIADPRPDGYVMRLDPDGGARIVADGFYFTNEIRLSADETILYVAETARGRVTAFDVTGSGELVNRRICGPDGLWPGALIDGVTVDSAGALWVTEITRNALVVLPPSGEPVLAVEDAAGDTMHFPTSITFAGPDFTTAYVGSLKMDRLVRFRSPVSGIEPVHWRIG